MQILEIDQFLSESPKGHILDVRSPKEFEHGHILNAESFPLFTDQERHDIGICYKQEGSEKAVILGLEIVGPKLADFVRKAEKYRDGPIYIHCWRGGMRSKSMATLLETVGHKVFLLKGGYKNYRTTVLSTFEKKYKLVNIAGYTGSAKTEILHILNQRSLQIIDLEGLAGHKGSAFGNLNLIEQPTSEQFENKLFDELMRLKINEPIYIEDESSMLGNVKMPASFFDSLQHAPMLFIEKERTLRLEHLMATYAKNQNKQAVKAAFNRIAKRLGGLQLQQSLKAVEEDDAETAVDIALAYYDKNYYKKLNSRLFSRFIKVDGNTSNEHIAYRIVEKTKLIYG